MVCVPQETRPDVLGTSAVPDRVGAVSVLRDPILWLMLSAGAILLLWGLGTRCLWQDEAETVLLGKAILRTGLPIAYDGTNVISQTQGREYDAHYLWHWSPWLQNYVAAGALAVFGDSNFAVRLPFVLAALLTIPLTYLLALELFGSVRVARLSALLLVLSVPFLLEARQARSYALAYPCVPLLLLALHRLQLGQRGGMIAFIAPATLLFYDHDFLAIGLLVPMVAIVLAGHPRWAFVRRLAVALGVIAVLVLPGVIYFILGNHGLGREHFSSWERFTYLFGFYGFTYATYLIPVPVLVALVYLLVRTGVSRELEGAGRRRAVGLLALTVLLSLYLCLAPLQSFRYQSVLLPVAAVLTALVVAWLWQRRAWLGAAVLLILVATNALQRFPVYYLQLRASPARPHAPPPDYVSSPLVEFLGEQSHPPEDPAGIVAQYLRAHARPEDVVVTTYDDLPLQFYTGLRVLGGLQGPQPVPPLPSGPDWIWIRSAWVNSEPGGDGALRNTLIVWWNRRTGAVAPRSSPAQPTSTWTAVINAWPEASHYEPVILADKDFFLANNPDPGFHLFRTPKRAPPIVLLHRVR